ncbi:MAG TPA: hypothetical protein VF753_05785 [Terriglobales bacterium]
MKRTVRMLILMVGLLFAYAAVAAPAVPVTEDGAPSPLCPPGSGGRC